MTHLLGVCIIKQFPKNLKPCNNLILLIKVTNIQKQSSTYDIFFIGNKDVTYSWAPNSHGLGAYYKKIIDLKLLMQIWITIDCEINLKTHQKL